MCVIEMNIIVCVCVCVCVCVHSAVYSLRGLQVASSVRGEYPPGDEPPVDVHTPEITHLSVLG